MPTKILYGKMFKLVYVREFLSKKRVLRFTECSDTKEVLDIVTVYEKRRCPFCSSSKCLRNIVYTDAFAYTTDSKEYAHLIRSDKLQGPLKLEMVKCNRTKNFFLVEHRFKQYTDAINMCPYCGSSHTESLQEGSFIEMGLPCPQNEGGVLLRKNPHKCKHCGRKFVGSLYFKDENKQEKKFNINYDSKLSK